MLGVDLMLKVRDISVSLHDRRWLVRALPANLVVLPAVFPAWWSWIGVLTASLLVFATAPGGPVLVKLATLVKGSKIIHAATAQASN